MRWFFLAAALLICGPVWAQALFLPDVTTPIVPPLNEQINILRRAINENAAAITPLDASRVPWSKLGVIADGVADNTAALNALPTGIPITADCVGGSFIRLDDTWNLQSNLNILFQPGCRMVSYSARPAVPSGPTDYTGLFAIGQADLNAPLTNVTLDGLTISKDAFRESERILRAWIDHFKLLNWTFDIPNDGGMFIRGSCQEIAYGRFTSDGVLAPGSPGIRHIGNVPKAADCREQLADVWVHDNHIISGDSAYQTCQPLNTSLWVNVSSDDFLWEKNTGMGGAFGLIGVDQGEGFNAYTCNKIVYRNNVGTGRHTGYLVASNGGPVTNLLVANQTLDISLGDNPSAGIRIRGNFDPIRPGSFSNIVFDGVSVYNTSVYAVLVDMPDAGTLNGLTIRNGTFATPRIVHSGAGTFQATVAIRGGNDVVLQNNIIYGTQSPGVVSVLLGNPSATDAAIGTVTRFRFLDNLISNVPGTSTALWLRNVAGATIAGNTIRRVAGAAAVQGVRLDNLNAVGPPALQPGATDITVSNNTLNDLATPINWTCNSGTTNFAIFNAGDVGRICP